jgi:transposase InsO family protein
MISHSDRKLTVELIQEANKNGARLASACKELNISVRTYQRWVKEENVREDQRPLAKRPEPKNKLSAEEKAEMLDVVKKEEFVDLPPSQIVPKLADQGIYIASESSFYRLLRGHNMQHHRGRSHKPQRRIPESHVAYKPNQVWTWDITWLNGPVLGMYHRLYLVIDLFSRKIVGWEIWETETAANAEKLIKKAVMKEEIHGKPLVLHSDNGSPMKAATFQATLEALGIQRSYSRPRVSNDNPYSESMFRTLKYRPEYPENGFETLEAARDWVAQLVHWYNYEHQHSGINFVTPHQCHAGVYIDILKYRTEVYEQAKLKRPERWSRSTRDWSPHESVALNPVNENERETTNASHSHSEAASY